MNITQGAIVRFILWALGVLNGTLVAFGVHTIPVNDDIINIIGAIIFMVATGLYAWYKNNPTSEFGLVCKRIKAICEEHGAEAVLEVILEEFNNYDAEHEEGDEDETDTQAN